MPPKCFRTNPICLVFWFRATLPSVSPLASESTLGTTVQRGSPTLQRLGSPTTPLNTVSAVLRCSLRLAGPREASSSRSQGRAKVTEEATAPLWLLREENLSLFAQPAPLQLLPRPPERSCLCLIYSRSPRDQAPRHYRDGQKETAAQLMNPPASPHSHPATLLCAPAT